MNLLNKNTPSLAPSKFEIAVDKGYANLLLISRPANGQQAI